MADRTPPRTPLGHANSSPSANSPLSRPTFGGPVNPQDRALAPESAQSLSGAAQPTAMVTSSADARAVSAVQSRPARPSHAEAVRTETKPGRNSVNGRGKADKTIHPDPRESGKLRKSEPMRDVTGRNGPPRRLKVTREGRYFLGITFGVGLAAINTGNNLLYLLLGVLLALVLVSGVMSELALRGLSVRRRLPNRAQVGRPHLVEIEVHNKKSRLPSYAIEVEDIRENQPADKRCFFLKVSPQSTQVAAYRRTPQRRGREAHVAFRVATRFPFGLFEKSRQIEVPGELIIYPAVHPVRLPLPRNRASGGPAFVPTRGGGDEMLGLRPYRPGDDIRQVHWRKTAAAGGLILREYAAEGSPEVTLELDDVCETPKQPEHEAERKRFLDNFEARLREVASRAVAHLSRGDQVTVRTSSGTRLLSNPRLGGDPILRFLALIEVVGQRHPSSLAATTSPLGKLSQPKEQVPNTGPKQAANRKSPA